MCGGYSLCYQRMQTLGKIYSVLTDKDKRAIYDEDGSIDEESSVFDQVCMDTVGPGVLSCIERLSFLR